jgi:hypothetical protein
MDSCDCLTSSSVEQLRLIDVGLSNIVYTATLLIPEAMCRHISYLVQTLYYFCWYFCAILGAGNQGLTDS